MRIRAAACIFLLVTLGTLLMVASMATASEMEPSDQWAYNFSLYLWLPSIDGTLGYNASGGGSGQEVDAGSIIEDIQGVFMGKVEVQKSRWSFQADLVYLDMADDKQDSVNVNIGPGIDISTGAEASLTGWFLDLSGAYRVHGSDRGTVYVLLGARYLEIDTEINLKISGPLPPTLPGRSLTGSTDILDGIVGVKGRLALGARWYVPYHLDLGAGTSKLTWQAMAGVGYEFKWCDILLIYRHLSFNEGSDKLLRNLTFSGPVLGVTFKF
jgi:opacity protein-like surface antigen